MLSRRILLADNIYINRLLHRVIVIFSFRNLKPVESWFVSMITQGEGWHNYHHAFPWDYKASELGMHFNNSAKLIRLFQRLGLAYDLKTASPEMVSDCFKTWFLVELNFFVTKHCLT